MPTILCITRLTKPCTRPLQSLPLLPRRVMVNVLIKMKKPKQLKELFHREDFAGQVLRNATLLENELDIILCQYFCQKRRVSTALLLLFQTMTWNNKIELFTNLPIRKSTKSYQTAISGLRIFKQLRNKVAHQWTVTTNEVEKLCRNKTLARMLDGFPNTMRSNFRDCRRALSRLSRTKEFRFEDSTYLSTIAITIDKLISDI